MNEWLIANLEKRLARMRRLATIAHDPEVIEIVKQNALEIEEDLKRLRGEALKDHAETGSTVNGSSG